MQGMVHMLSTNCIPGPKDMGADPEREKRWVRSHGPAGPGVQSELQGTISPLPLRAAVHQRSAVRTLPHPGGAA